MINSRPPKKFGRFTFPAILMGIGASICLVQWWYGRLPLDWQMYVGPYVRATICQYASLTDRARGASIYDVAVYRDRVFNDSAIDVIRVPLIGSLTILGGAILFGLLRDLSFYKRRREGVVKRGPKIVSWDEFNKQIRGNGWPIAMESDSVRVAREIDRRTSILLPCAAKYTAKLLQICEACKPPSVRIEKDMEAQHILVVGDTGTGKTQLFYQRLDYAEKMGVRCVVHDPHLQYVTRYYRPERGDLIMNPLDDRCPSWSPSDEVWGFPEQRTYANHAVAEALAMSQAESIYSGLPGDRDWFFTRVCRLVYQHCCMTYAPTAQEMAFLWSNMDPLIDAVVEGTELVSMLRENAAHQRGGIEGTLTQPAYAFRQVPAASPDRPRWTAMDYVANGKGWLFFTNDKITRESLRPLQSLWIDSIIKYALSVDADGKTPWTYLALDEVSKQQRLPSLEDAITDARKFRISIMLGIQGRKQMNRLYGDDMAEVILSNPATKVLLKTGEPEAQDWASRVVGEQEKDYLTENRGDRSDSFSYQRQVSRAVLASEFSGLSNRHGYLKYGNLITSVRVPIIDKKSIAQPLVGRVLEPFQPKQMPNLETAKALKKKREVDASTAQAAAFLAAKVQSSPTTFKPPRPKLKKKKAEQNGDLNI